MGDCCDSHRKDRKALCPEHGGECYEVAFRTVIHHVKAPWRHNLPEQRYFFCEEARCPIVYFGENGVRIRGDELRVSVGQKIRGEADSLCYCFDIHYGEARRDSALKEYVVEKTRSGLCSCETQNPSGRCCLKDFPE